MAQETLAELQARQASLEQQRQTLDQTSEQYRLMSEALDGIAARIEQISKNEQQVLRDNKVRLESLKTMLEYYTTIQLTQKNLTDDSEKEVMYKNDLNLAEAKLNQSLEQKRQIHQEILKIENSIGELEEPARLKALEDLEIKKKEAKLLDDRIYKEQVLKNELQQFYDAGEEHFNASLSWMGITDEKQKLSATQSMLLGKVSDESFARRAKQFFESGVALERIYVAFAEKVLEMTLLMAKQLDVVRADAYKASGGFQALSDEIMSGTENAGQFGVSADAMSKSYLSLTKNSSNFSELTAQQQRSVAANTAQLQSMGVSADVASKNFSLFTQSLGMTTQQANASSRELVSLAHNLHMSVEEVTDGFGQAATTVAAYGQGAVREFSRLAAESKALGLSVQELINIVKGADTFQGAAEQAGKLNAMLGGGLLNSSQLLVASESERIQLIRDAVMQTGRSFSTMSKYEQIAIANAAGIQDLTVAQKLFNNEISGGELDRYLGKTNALGQSEEQMAEQAAAARETTENLKIIMEQFAAAIAPVVRGVAAVIGFLSQYAFILKPIATVIALVSAALFVYITYQGIQQAMTITNIALSNQNLSRLVLEAQARQLNISQQEIEIAVQNRGIIAKVSSMLATVRSTAAKIAENIATNGGILAEGRRIIMLGLSKAAQIAAAVATGIMTAAQWALGAASAFASGRLMLLVNVFLLLFNVFHMTGSPMLYLIFGFIAIGIIVLGQAAEKSQKGLYALGASMLMVGTGAFLAFHGLEGFATALAALDPTQLAALVAVILILALTMAGLFALVIIVGSSAVGPMLALGAAFLLIGAGAYLAGLGLSLVVNAFANLATNIVALLLLPLFLQLMAVGFIALTISLYAFGTTLPIIMLAIPLLFGLGIALGTIAAAMLVAAIASVIFGGGLMLIGSALSNFTVGAATGIIAVAGSLLILQYSLIAIGASMVAFYIPILAAIGMIGLLGIALATISPEKSIALKTTTDSIRNFVDTGKDITPETVSNLGQVVKQIHKLNVEATISKALNVTAPFKELIDAINGQTAATAAGKETTVVMKLNDREFGRAVVGVMNEYGTLNTSMRKPTPA